MTRRVLFCTIGATPQVVTETVWALNRRTPPWIPDEIHIVTTTFALERIRAALLSPTGQLAALFGGTPPPVSVHVPTRGGPPLVISRDTETAAPPADALRDVNTQGDAAAMGTLILRILAAITRDDDTELHVSLAGGRKTMSAHALLAMSLVARPRDEASHVLVAPEAFEDNFGFWDPGQADWVRPRPPATELLDPSEAVVTLVPLLRHEVKDAAALAALDLTEMVNLVNLAATLPASPGIRLDLRSNELIAGEVRRRLKPKEFALYRLVATARKHAWPGVGPDGEGEGHAGWLSLPHICAGHTPDGDAIAELFMAYLKLALVVEKGIWGATDHISEASWQKVLDAQPLKDKLASAQNSVGSLTRVTGALVAAFGRPAAAIIGPTTEKHRQMTPTARTGWTRYGLKLPADGIEIL